MNCPECGGTDLNVFYTAPLVYECKNCGVEFMDPDEAPAVRVLTAEEGKKLRPELYKKGPDDGG